MHPYDTPSSPSPKKIHPTTHKARHQRNNPTPAEAAAWSLLRKRKIFNLRFNRQKPLHGLIVDFYCDQLALAIDISPTTPATQIPNTNRALILASHNIRLIFLDPDHITLPNLTLTLSQFMRQ
jgi:very-short-patch-repair endonuclease